MAPHGDRKEKHPTVCLLSSSSEDGREDDEIEEIRSQLINGDRKRKHPVVCLSSGSSSSEDSSDDDEVEEISVEEYNSNDEEDDDEEEDNDESGSYRGEDDDDDDEALCGRVISLLKERNDLEGLCLKHFKAYLRKYGVRLAGTKTDCIQRIKEHWRLKDGNGKAIYPRSSFVINCRGDVCKGDVVLFTQKVYAKFNKVTRHGKILGRRTVAGRVVNESYGSAKQQHTFSVDVLWSKGVKKLPPLFPLLVKGRNLYKLGTSRQCWNNEAERQKVLAEKHQRGTAARLKRAMTKSKKIKSKSGDTNFHKHSHHEGSSQMRKTAQLEKRKPVDGNKGDISWQIGRFKSHHQDALALTQLNFNRDMNPCCSKTFWKHQKRRHINVDMVPTLHAHACSLQEPCKSHRERHHRSVPSQLFYDDMNFPSTGTSLPPLRPYAGTMVIPFSQYQDYSRSSGTQYHHSSPSFNFQGNNLNFPTANAQKMSGYQKFHLRDFITWRI